MPLVFLVVDKFSQHELTLYEMGIRRFFLTDYPALRGALHLRGVDVIVDNGTYKFGRPSLGLLARAIVHGFKFILPDVVGDFNATLQLHLKFAEKLSERDLRNAFVVLQCRTPKECIEQLETYREHGLVKKYVALGGPKELRRRKTEDAKLVSAVWAYTRKRGLWLHVLGRAHFACDSFDTSAWGKRLLDRKLKGLDYDYGVIVNFVRKYETQTRLFLGGEDDTGN